MMGSTFWGTSLFSQQLPVCLTSSFGPHPMHAYPGNWGTPSLQFTGKAEQDRRKPRATRPFHASCVLVTLLPGKLQPQCKILFKPSHKPSLRTAGSPSPLQHDSGRSAASSPAPRPPGCLQPPVQEASLEPSAQPCSPPPQLFNPQPRAQRTPSAHGFFFFYCLHPGSPTQGT